MGQYINQTSKGEIGTSFNDKCTALSNDSATRILTPTVFQDNLVCVVDNGMFAAAAYAYSEAEMEAFKRLDERRKQWFVYPNAKEYAQ